MNKILKNLILSAVLMMSYAGLSAFTFTSSAVKSYEVKLFDGDLPDWALLDPEVDGYEGTRTLTFYKYIESLPNPRERKDVIVAVIDSGFDINHPDLKENVWQNEKEVNGTAGVDDDNNGYVDDFHGWNFLGNVQNLPLEFTREYFRLKKEGVSESDPYFKKVKQAYEEEKSEVEENYKWAAPLLKDYIEAENILKRRNYPTEPEKLKGIAESLDGEFSEAASLILTFNAMHISKNDLQQLAEGSVIERKMLTQQGIDEIKKIGDNPEQLDEKGYGSNQLYIEGETHGTHVAGIIASRKTGIGQAPFAKLMLLRAVPNEGDERDKDIGNAIRYAVDNGAHIINMSAGKYFSVHPDYVINAIKYAEEKGVLFVNSAGNESSDIETTVNYPAKFYTENGQMKYFNNMLVVGASSWMQKWQSEKDPDNLAEDFDLSASFSNYSSKVVDVFAPGLYINSTVPGGYERISGTSMASPEAAGVAAILKAYFPELSASQLKQVIMDSVRKYPDLKVKVRGKNSRVPFEQLSKSGGVIDVMNAYLLAERMILN